MALLKSACLFALALTVVANPLHHRQDDGGDDEPEPTTKTVIVTATEVLPIVTVLRTSTRTLFTSTTTIDANIDCTRTVYTAAPQPIATSTAPPATSASSGAARRQESDTSSADVPVVTISTTRTIPAQTRTAWTVITATQEEPTTRFRYQCGHTLAYLLTTDATTTISFTQTEYASTQLAVSTVSCPLGAGVGGFGGGFGGGGGFGMAPAATNVKRQSDSSSEAPSSGGATVVDPTGYAPVISTIHITRTVNTRVTITATEPTTSIRYECAAATTSSAAATSSAPARGD